MTPEASKIWCGDNKIQTALGCLDVSSGEALVSQIVGVFIGLAGAITLILLLYGFFTLSTSAGNPDKVNAGKGVITSSLGGLAFILLSVIIFKIIGVDVLQIPGLK